MLSSCQAISPLVALFTWQLRKSGTKKLQHFADKAIVWHGARRRAAGEAFQKATRGDCTVMHDHICKEMNELNLERCRCI